MAALPDAACGDHQQALELFLAPGGHEGSPLHGAHLGADADSGQIVANRLSHAVEGRRRVEVAGIKAVRIASLGQQALGPGGIVGHRFQRQRELHIARDDGPRRPAQSHALGLVDRLPVDGQVGGQPHPLVMPGRFGVPLLRELQVPDRRWDD